jgi:hypothetical protein
VIKLTVQFTISSIRQNLPRWMLPTNFESHSHTKQAQCCVFTFLARCIATERGSPLKVGRISNLARGMEEFSKRCRPGMHTTPTRRGEELNKPFTKANGELAETITQLVTPLHVSRSNENLSLVVQGHKNDMRDSFHYHKGGFFCTDINVPCWV